MNKSILVAALLAVALTACGKKEEPEGCCPGACSCCRRSGPAVAPQAGMAGMACRTGMAGMAGRWYGWHGSRQACAEPA